MKKALVIGIDDYGVGNSLSGCCNDAREVCKMLSTNGDGSPNFDVKLLLNIKTKSELRKSLNDCFSRDDDVALFYFSGHGFVDSFGGYLATPDYSEYDVGVPLQDILTIVNGSKCKERIVIIDSCYSGKMGNSTNCNNNLAEINEGVTILTACRDNETAGESNSHGVFTELFLEALSGCAADLTGNITPGSIYAYVDKALGPWNQRPVFKTNVTRFTSLRNVLPQVRIEVIRKICDYFENADDEFKLDPSYEPTNCLDYKHQLLEPYSIKENTKVFKDLQELEGIGVITPVGEKHMYYAAMNSKSCKLTSIGKQYWKLAKESKI